MVTGKAGKPVSGLELKDFSVLDNKQPDKVVSFQAFDGTVIQPDPPVEVILLIDTINRYGSPPGRDCGPETGPAGSPLRHHDRIRSGRDRRHLFPLSDVKRLHREGAQGVRHAGMEEGLEAFGARMTMLNDVVFTQDRRFGSESPILTGYA